MKRLLLIAAALAFSATAAAQTYKWVDKDGKVRYGDTPPPDARAQRLKPPPGPAEAPAAAPDGKKPLSPEAAFRKRQQEKADAEQKAQKEADDAQRRRENCESAQGRLRLLESGARVTTTNKDGEREFISDEARARDIERTRKAVSEACSG
jgi:hypothetical protein